MSHVTDMPKSEPTYFGAGPVKLCADCVQHGDQSTCKRTQHRSLIDGSVSRVESCATERECGPILCRVFMTCGREGRFWEKKNAAPT